jgi:precorrin-4 methylase
LSYLILNPSKYSILNTQYSKLNACRQLGLAALAFCVVFLLAWAVNLPKFLAVTHPEVVQTKVLAREQCRIAVSQNDMLTAEQLIRNNTVGVELAKKFNKQARQVPIKRKHGL